MEAKFYRRLREFLNREGWFLQRIETTTGAGVPDLYAFDTGSGKHLWVELKALANVKIRPAQYAWITRAKNHGISCLVLNYHPRKDLVEGWVDVAINDKGKLTTEPDFSVDAKEFFRLGGSSLLITTS